MELYADPTVIAFSTGNPCEYDDFWLDDLNCSGDEEYLADCIHLAYGSPNCNPARECVEVFCQADGPTGRIVIETNLVIPESAVDT